MDAKKLIDWLGHKADECGRKLDALEDEYTAEYGYWDGYMECCNELLDKIRKGELEVELELIDEKISQLSVTDDDVQKAIKYQQKHIDEEMFAWEHTDEEWQNEPGAEEQYHDFLDCHDLAITALQQMQKEPCEYCKDGVYYDVLGSPCKYNNCPMCGRKLR